MTPLTSVDNPNCIPVPAGCVEWNYGSIPYLGICNGDKLPTIIWEIVNKLQGIAGEDISGFDLDNLLAICNAKAPLETSLIKILEILRDNQICLKDYIVTLQETISELQNNNSVSVNLKCFADFDNFGNQLSIDRNSLDQLVIDKLCSHDNEITNLSGKVISLQNQINSISVNPIVSEPEFSTCIDGTIKSTSGQTISIANKVCDIDTKLSSITIPTALGKTPSFWVNPEYINIPGWIPSSNPIYNTLSASYNNLLLAYSRLQTQVDDILSTCCAPTCAKIQIGFSLILDTSPDYLVRFRPTDGTNLFGFISTNSKIKFTGYSKTTGLLITTAELNVDINDEDGTSNSYALETTFDISKPITVTITANMVKDGLTCQKCISQTIDLSAGCPVCEVAASGAKGDPGQITITYEY